MFRQAITSGIVFASVAGAERYKAFNERVVKML
jgi:hypothetical protein